MASRSLHLIYIKNFAAGGDLDPPRAVTAAELYRSHAPDSDREVTVSAAGTLSLVAAHAAFRETPHVLGLALNGVDRLTMLGSDPIIARIGRVVIGSGDGVFTGSKQPLTPSAPVGVATRAESLSARLELSAAHTVTWRTDEPLAAA